MNDILKEFNGAAVGSKGQFQALSNSLLIGQEVPLSLLREGGFFCVILQHLQFQDENYNSNIVT